MKKICLLILTFLSPLVLHAGEILNVFGGGVFDVTWGQDIPAVKAVHKQAKKKSYGNVVHLEIKDGRRVLGVERRPKDKIVFGFDSDGHLSSVGVYFKPDRFGDVLHKLNTVFGPQANTNKESSFGVITEWPVDNGMKISLAHVSMGLTSDVVFTIENHALLKPNADRESLGF